MKDLAQLFLIFAKLGAFTFGGGYAMLPLIQREFVEKRNWATDQEMLDYFAIGQCMPGVIAVNTATFIGYKRKGIAGGIASTLGMVFPSVVIILIIAAFIANFSEYAIVAHILNGVRVVVAVLIINAVLSMWKNSVVDKICIGLVAISFILSLISVSPVYLVIGAALAGIALSALKERGAK